MTNCLDEQGSYDEEEKMICRICCADRQEVSSDPHFSLDLELVFIDEDYKIGQKLMKSSDNEKAAPSASITESSSTSKPAGLGLMKGALS